MRIFVGTLIFIFVLCLITGFDVISSMLIVAFGALSFVVAALIAFIITLVVIWLITIIFF